jgi:hypothetical protein
VESIVLWRDRDDIWRMNIKSNSERQDIWSLNSENISTALKTYLVDSDINTVYINNITH